MSLNRLKETLLGSTTTDSSSSSSSSAASSFSLSEPLPPLRKPPKSSLSQQLQRLHLPSASSSSSDPPPLPPPPRRREEEEGHKDEYEDEDEDDDGEGYGALLRPNREPVPSQPCAFEPRGPYEPLVLSPPREDPIVQVPASINCRLLEHQRDGVRFLYNLYKNNHGGVLGDDMRLLQQPDIQCLVNKDLPCSCGSPLTQVECCKKIEPKGIIWSYLHKDNPDGCALCPFCLVLPCLVKLQQVSNHLELIKPNPKDEIEKQKKDSELAAAVFGDDINLVGGGAKSESFMGLSDAEHCGKMRALEKLLASWASRGDKILLFSYSVRMLDILEKFLIRKGYCFSRFDGSTPMNARQSLVDEFNRSPSKQVFLISTRAGNLGVNLVSANRVVIFDPSWNPAQDLQAQDRSFRYGQKRHVVVFRLLAAGSFEELVYSRQVYKQQLSNIAVSGKVEKRYFEGVQDCKKFQGELFGICNLFRDLSDKLFTSEIIEMHEEQGKNSGTDKVPVSQKIDVKSTTNEAVKVSNLLKSYGEATHAENEATLDDLGIVYAHRNEDVVNMKMGGNHGGISTHEDDTNTTCPTKAAGRSHGRKHVKLRAGEPSLAHQKRREFSRIARYMNMGELEFSKWLLSASNLERIEMLQNYKKTMKKKKKKKQKVEVY